MKTDASDLKRLKWAILILLLMAGAGAAAVWTTMQMQKAGEKASREATAARNEIRGKLALAREEQAELREKITRFQALQQSGVIGPEQRLDWIEALARIRVAHRIQRLDYDFAPQRPVEATILPGGPTAGGFDIMASQMRMQVHLLHEGELLSLIDDIRNSVRALIQIRSCSMERIPAGVTERGNPAQLKAECTLEWITLKERK